MRRVWAWLTVRGMRFPTVIAVWLTVHVVLSGLGEGFSVWKVNVGMVVWAYWSANLLAAERAKSAYRTAEHDTLEVLRNDIRRGVPIDEDWVIRWRIETGNRHVLDPSWYPPMGSRAYDRHVKTPAELR